MNKIIFGAALIALAGVFYLMSAPKDPLVCPDCNVIVIGFDALQAAHVSHLGYARDTTPNLDALAARGFTFTNAISPASWTVPGFMSIMTGTFPSVHKVTNKFTKFTPGEKVFTDLKIVSPDIQTIAEVMRKAGYRTAGFTGDAGVNGRFGYREGFEVYVDDQTFGSFTHSTEGAVAWLDTLQPDEKFFMFYHGYDAHGQFDIAEGYQSRYSPEGYDGRYKGTEKEQEALREQGLKDGSIALRPEDVEFWRAWYDGKIRDADERFGAFIDELEKRGLLENTIIVLASDHGTEFYEHERFDHGHTLYDELIRVPLIVVPPERTGGTRIDAQVTTLDLAPTIFGMLSLDPGEHFRNQLQGVSLVPLMKGDIASGHDVFIETDYRNYTHLRAIRSADGWKYILNLKDKSEELYDLNADPGELTNKAGSETEKRDELRRQLLTHMRDQLGQTTDQEYRSDCLPVYAEICGA